MTEKQIINTDLRKSRLRKIKEGDTEGLRQLPMEGVGRNIDWDLQDKEEGSDSDI